MQVHLLTIRKKWCCVPFLNSLVNVSSNDPAAVKEVGSVVTWGKIQTTPELLVNSAIQKFLKGVWLRRHVENREILKILMGARLRRQMGK